MPTTGRTTSLIQRLKSQELSMQSFDVHLIVMILLKFNAIMIYNKVKPMTGNLRRENGSQRLPRKGVDGVEEGRVVCERSEREDGWKVEGAADPQSKKQMTGSIQHGECHVG